MRLIITRHGETEENKAGIMQGHLPGKLSAEGIRQAQKVAERLKSEKIDFIFSSDLARAADTAVEISLYHPEAKLELTQELRERNLGEFTGKNISEAVLHQKGSTAVFAEIKTGETEQDLYKRAAIYLEKTLELHPDHTVLLVGHSGINKALIAVITRRTHDYMKTMETQHNTNISIFEIDENKNHKTHLLNDIEHLK